MIRKILREYYLLPRGEQRAVILLSLLVILTLGTRILAGMLPSREPAGLELFQEEARAILSHLAAADSVKIISTGNHVQTRARTEPRSIGLNEADSLSLLSLPGIGPVFAGRIVKYRDLLGGYCRVEQLSEIYGMKQETVDLVSPFLLIDTLKLKKLYINHSGFRDLLRHPYLEFEDVKALLNYMDIMGSIASKEEIRLNGLLADSTLERIAPYLEFGN